MKAKCLAVVAGLLAGPASAKLLDVFPRLISYNIRWAVPSPSPPEPAWAERLPKLRSQLNFETAGRPETLLCMQEVIASQLQDVREALGEESWDSIGVGRDDGVDKGEFSPIFYRPDTWELESNTTYWLSETPKEIGSVGWDAALPRVVTVGQFKHRRSGLPFVYMCTHFDHVGVVAREESAKLLVKLAREYAESTAEEGEEPTPVFLGGDLNITPDNPAYLEMIAEGNFDDVRDVIDKSRIHGHFGTFTGFDWNGEDELGRIDHIFRWRQVRDLDLLTYGVIENRFDDKLWISDHRAVVVDTHFVVNKTCTPRR